MAETGSECLKEVLAKIQANLVSKKERRESKVVKAKEELAEMEKKAREKAMEAYKTLVDFMVEKS